MKTIATTIFILLTTFLYAQGPKLEIVRVYDFGTKQQGDNISHDFVAKNTGDKPLIFSRVASSCGCDVAYAKETLVEPGDSTIINYKYDSKRIGVLNKSFTITSNDPVNPTVVVRVKGMVEMPKKAENHKLLTE